MRIPFSQKYGDRKPKVDIQLKQMDDRLKNRLWNCLSIHYFDDYRHTGYPPVSDETKKLTIIIWHELVGQTIDSIPSQGPCIYSKIRELFFQLEWDLAYDFIQFAIDNYEDPMTNYTFAECCNQVLEQEKSGYRIIGGTLTDIISKGEISEIEQALECQSDPARELLRKAFRQYSSRDSPDYPNAIKDSISAVESLCKTIAGDESKTLGQALPTVAKKLEIDSVLASSIEKIWAFRNIKEGVGHGSTKPINVTPEEARLCLITCSAWINFLELRVQQKRIQILNH